MKKSISFLFCFLLAGMLFAQPGSIDLTFNPDDPGFNQGAGPNESVFTIVKQADGKILIGGGFAEYNGVSRNGIARLNHDGTLDHTFDPGDGFEVVLESGTVLKGFVEAIEILPDGKILAGGEFSRYNNTDVSGLVRLLPDGALDSDFEIDADLLNRVSSLCLQPDGKILAGGSFIQPNKDISYHIKRFLPHGEADHTFSPPQFNGSIFSIAIDSEERILTGGVFHTAGGINSHRLARLYPDGSIDTSFLAAFPGPGPFWGGQPPCIYTVSTTPDNKILVSGYLLSYNDEAVGSMVRLHNDGSMDDDFHFPVGGLFTAIYRHSPLSSGKYAIAGNFRIQNDFGYDGLAIIHPDGSFYTPFQAGILSAQFMTVIEQDNGELLTGGEFRTDDIISSNTGIYRFTEDGSLDMTFNQVSGANDVVSASYIQDDGKIVIGGRFNIYNGIYRSYVARLHPDGSPDEDFSPGRGFAIGLINSVAAQNDGKVLVAGVFNSFDGFPSRGFVRLNSSGDVDTSFQVSANSSIAYSAKAQSDGKIVIAGRFTTINDHFAKGIARLYPDGSVDEGFQTGDGVAGYICDVVFQPDGKIIIVGKFSRFNNITRNGIARLNNDGSLDTGFDPGSGAEGETIYTAELQSDGKIVIGGLFTSFNSHEVNRIARLNSDGSLDDSFDPGAGVDGSVRSIVVQQNGKIVIGGAFKTYDMQEAPHIARLNPDGSYDHDFITGSGFNDIVYTLSLNADGNILAAGSFTAYDGTGRNRLARIKGGEPEGTGRIFSQNGWQVFPNPATERITVKNNQGAEMTGLRLFDLHGRVLRQIPDLRSDHCVIEAGALSKGVYILEVKEDDKSVRLKILKQ